jgi:hypothetical protein
MVETCDVGSNVYYIIDLSLYLVVFYPTKERQLVHETGL